MTPEEQIVRDREEEAVRTGEKSRAQVKRERDRRRAVRRGTLVRPPVRPHAPRPSGNGTVD